MFDGENKGRSFEVVTLFEVRRFYSHTGILNLIQLPRWSPGFIILTLHRFAYRETNFYLRFYHRDRIYSYCAILVLFLLQL